MSSLHIHESPLGPPWPASATDHWYAIQTVARQEKYVARQLQAKQVRMFLPLIEQLHQWSDRKAWVKLPLFSGYLFVRIASSPEEHLQVVRIPGVLRVVGSNGHASPIPDEQIEGLQATVQKRIPLCEHPFISAGKHVRIRGGALDGVEGILVGHGSHQSLILSINLLCRSVVVRVEGYDVELL